MCLQIHRAAIHVRKPLPAGLLLADDPTLVQISIEPRIVLLQNALTAAECQVRAEPQLPWQSLADTKTATSGPQITCPVTQSLTLTVNAVMCASRASSHG